MILGWDCLPPSASSPPQMWTTTLGVVGVPECSSNPSPDGMKRRRALYYQTDHSGGIAVCASAPTDIPGSVFEMSQNRSRSRMGVASCGSSQPGSDDRGFGSSRRGLPMCTDYGRAGERQRGSGKPPYSLQNQKVNSCCQCLFHCSVNH